MPCEVVLRPLEVGDAEAYARWMQDAELRELTGSEPLTADDMRRVASAAAADPATAAFLIAVPALAAELPPEGLVGDVNVRLNDADEPRRAELDVMVAVCPAQKCFAPSPGGYCLCAVGPLRSSEGLSETGYAQRGSGRPRRKKRLSVLRGETNCAQPMRFRILVAGPYFRGFVIGPVTLSRC